MEKVKNKEGIENTIFLQTSERLTHTKYLDINGVTFDLFKVRSININFDVDRKLPIVKIEYILFENKEIKKRIVEFEINDRPIELLRFIEKNNEFIENPLSRKPMIVKREK